MAEDLNARLIRIEAKIDRLQLCIDHLIAALAEELDDDPPALALDGTAAGAERAEHQEL